MYNLRFVKDYLLHRFKAKSRHGLHSPFVYRLVDKVIYDFSAKKVYGEIENDKLIKVDRLIYRLVADKNPNNIILLGNIDSNTKTCLQKASPQAHIYTNINNEIENIDLAFISPSNGQDTLTYFENCLPKAVENTMLILNGIYKDKTMKQEWNEIKTNPKVTVTVDLFWIGLVYFRSGQVKENFKIKF